MTIENAKVLYKHFLELGRKKHAEQLEARYPELKDETIKTDSTDKEAEEEEQPMAEVKDGKKSKRRAK